MFRVTFSTAEVTSEQEGCGTDKGCEDLHLVRRKTAGAYCGMCTCQHVVGWTPLFGSESLLQVLAC